MEKATRKIQKERTHAGLVEHAKRLFSEKGISATTTADIAKALRVSHGTVFVHFSTREQLVQAVVEKFGEALSAELGARLSSHLTLKEMLQVHLAVLAEFEDFYVRIVAESQSLPPQIRSFIFAMNASLSYRFFRAAQQAMKNGEIKPMAQAPFFNTWLSLLHYHLLNRDLFSEKTPALKHIGGDLIQHFFLLIKT